MVLQSLFLGFGAILTGEAGSGKSATALALLSRGHRLVADDAVRIVRRQDRYVACAPNKFFGKIYVRNRGLFAVDELFGIRSVAREAEIDFHFVLGCPEYSLKMGVLPFRSSSIASRRVPGGIGAGETAAFIERKLISATEFGT